MEYLNFDDVDWDKIHAAHNERVKELRAAFKVVVMQDIESGLIPAPEI